MLRKQWMVSSISLSILLALCITTVTLFYHDDIAEADPIDNTGVTELVNDDTTQSSNSIAKLITKNGATQEFDTCSTIDQVPFSYKSDRLANDKISIHPCYRSVDSEGNVTYKEGSSCVSITGHGLANHKKVHIWDNSHNEIELIAKNPYDPFKPAETLHYRCLDHASALALFTNIEVTDKSSSAGKYLRGTSYAGNTSHPWQSFHFDFYAKVDGRNAYVVKWVNDAGNLPVGLTDESSTKNGTTIETKHADSPDLWVIEVDHQF